MDMSQTHYSRTAFNHDQSIRASKLFASVVLAALDDAIVDQQSCNRGVEQISRWARSRDGKEVLMCAGIEPNERVVQAMAKFVRNGMRTSTCLSREEAKRSAKTAA